MQNTITTGQGTNVEYSRGEMDKWSGETIRTLEKTWQGTLLTMGEDGKLGSDFAGIRSEMTNAVQPLLKGKSSNAIREGLARAQQVIAAFLQTRDVVSHIDRRGLIDLAQISVESSLQPESMKDVEMRIGFGADATAVPNARIPSYILSAKRTLLDLQKAFPDQSVDALPRVVPYSAAKFVASVNTADGPAREAAAQQNFAFLRAYLQRFSPQLAGQFQFDEDRPVRPNEQLAALVDVYADALKNVQDAPSAGAVGKAKAMGARNGSTEADALRYAGSHALYAADDVAGPAEPILQNSAARPKKVVMIGGKAEKDFWRIREALRSGVTIQGGIAFLRERIAQQTDQLDSDGHKQLLQRFEAAAQETAPADYKRVQMISRAGEKVPVYNHTQGDWSIVDMTQRSFEDFESSLDGRLKPDLLAVLCDIAEVPLKEAYAGSSKKTFSPDVREKLQSAYAQYAQFCQEYLEGRNS